MMIIAIYLYTHENKSPWDCVTKSHWILMALLIIKKSFKSIDFDLAKHVLVFPSSLSPPPPPSPLSPPLAMVELILIDQGIATIMYSYLFDSTKIKHSATHLNIQKF